MNAFSPNTHHFDTSTSKKNLSEVIEILKKKEIDPKKYEKLKAFLEAKEYERFVTFL